MLKHRYYTLSQVILHSLRADEVQIAPSSGCCHFVLKIVRQSHMQWKKCHKTGPNRCIINSRKGKENGQASIYCLICVPCIANVVM